MRFLIGSVGFGSIFFFCLDDFDIAPEGIVFVLYTIRTLEMLLAVPNPKARGCLVDATHFPTATSITSCDRITDGCDHGPFLQLGYALLFLFLQRLLVLGRLGDASSAEPGLDFRWWVPASLAIVVRGKGRHLPVFIAEAFVVWAE